MNSFKDSLKPSKKDLINSINESYREEIMSIQLLLSWIVDDDTIEKARIRIEHLKSKLEIDKRMFSGLDVIDSDIFEKVADLEERLLESEKMQQVLCPLDKKQDRHDEIR